MSLHYEKKSCDLGNAQQCFFLFYKYKESDFALALQFIKRACDLDYRYCSNVGDLLEEKESKKDLLERDYTQVLEFHRRGCERSGNANSIYCKEYKKKSQQYE